MQVPKEHVASLGHAKHCTPSAPQRRFSLPDTHSPVGAQQPRQFKRVHLGVQKVVAHLAAGPQSMQRLPFPPHRRSSVWMMHSPRSEQHPGQLKTSQLTAWGRHEPPKQVSEPKHATHDSPALPQALGLSPELH